MNKKLRITLFVLGLLFLGFFREYIFLGMNRLLYNKFYHPAGMDLHVIEAPFTLLNGFSYYTVYTIKWFITPVFLFLFWFIQKKMLFTIFTEKKTNQWLGVLYLSLLLLAGISFGTGWAAGHIHDGYRFSRIFMGLAESPVPCMILIPLTYFYKNYNTEA